MTDDSVAEWLWQGRRRDEEDVDEPKAPAEAARDAEGPEAEQPARPGGTAGETAVLPALTDRIRLIRLDDQGALFEFSAEMLLRADFRCAMPRRCLRCGTRRHLEAHLIIYASRLVDSFSLETESRRIGGGALTVRGRDLRDLPNEELLSRLPEVANIPPPGNLPMPYWLCDMCSGTGLISGQILMNPATGKGSCQLLIGNMRRAEEFLVAAGGTDSAGHAEFRNHIESAPETPWDGLPETVQHRVAVWYKPARGERFLAYVPDHDLVRSEDGMAGIVVSNRRMIHHTQLRHREATPDQPLRIEVVTSGDRKALRIDSPAWQVKRFSVDDDGVALLRRALSAGKFNATWH